MKALEGASPHDYFGWVWITVEEVSDPFGRFEIDFGWTVTGPGMMSKTRFGIPENYALVKP